MTVLVVLLSKPKVSCLCIEFCRPIKLYYICNSCLLTSVPLASGQQREPHHSLHLFVLISFTTMLAAYPQAFLPRWSANSGCRWNGPPPIQSIPPHSLIHTCGQTQLQQYKHTKSPHSFSPNVCLSAQHQPPTVELLL